jgi:hypothetical protein
MRDRDLLWTAERGPTELDERTGMQRLKKPLPSPAMVVAILALIVALAGTAIAAKGGGKRSPSRKQVIELAKKIADQRIARLAPGLSVASAANATNAANASTLSGKPASAFAGSQVEPTHRVGTAGQPAFENAWSNFGAGLAPVGFYKDPLGLVHLVGTISRTGEGGVSAFVLPPGYRPADSIGLPLANSAGIGITSVDPDGEVRPLCPGQANCNASIDGTFRPG